MDKMELDEYTTNLAVIVRHFGGNRALASRHVVKRAKLMCCSVKTAASIISSEMRCTVAASAFDNEDREANRRHEDDRR